MGKKSNHTQCWFLFYDGAVTDTTGVLFNVLFNERSRYDHTDEFSCNFSSPRHVVVQTSHARMFFLGGTCKFLALW